jgi:hypothetical protein
MFNFGKPVYVIDNMGSSDKVKVVQYTSNGYKTADGTKIEITNGSKNITIDTWACFPSVEDATKFGILWLVNTLEFKTPINKENINQQYIDLEEQHADLIMKYMNKVVEEI